MTENLHAETCTKSGLTAKIKAETVKYNPQTVCGIGDDCAVSDFSDGKKIVSTLRIFAEGIHFDLVYTPLKHLGYKIVTATLSNIYAMNAKPLQISVALSVSNVMTGSRILEFYGGVRAACEDYKADLIGGDLTSSRKGITIAVSATGIADENGLVFRTGAKPTDLLCVTGDLGAAYMGLQLLEREKTVFNSAGGDTQPQLGGYDYILRRQLKPECPKELLNYFKTKGIKPTSMISLSSSLAGEIVNLCNASNAGCEIFEERIPIAHETEKMAKEFNINPLVTALNGGEDYGLLFTIELKNYEKIKNTDMFSIIGSINAADKGRNIVLSDGSIVTIEQTSDN